eukprot:CAMPEP_0179012302 /NCGR_PEP_ID=MMETSP0796-20121207/1126_1 /TAXON_ID=73915 /ORGANISM="Pyrodinium bahamense, Strain pbaha01" /LENGTH=332 /DNA_ID=CAMNT_0020707741 /DNA_START=77 /DNA_END=1071 /DNA_ORIENTATION=+
MPCCSERHEPREAPGACIVLVVVAWAIASIGILGLGASLHEFNLSFHRALNWHMCTALQWADEAVGGSAAFLGTALGAAHLEEIAKGLDVDGSTMQTIRRVIRSTSEFAIRHGTLRQRISHFSSVLSRSGPGHRVFDHRCVFCSMAIGDKNHRDGGLQSEGLLPALLHELTESSSEAMHRIRQIVIARLSGENLTALAHLVKRAHGAFEILDFAFQSSLVDIWARHLPSVDIVEWIRLAAFFVLGVCSIAGGVVGWLAFLATRLRARSRPDLVPSGKPHCCAWCCGFCYATFALLLSGGLLVLAVGVGEGCVILRQELMVGGDFSRQAGTLG